MNDIKVAYIARSSVPSASTNSIHVAKIAEAFKEITGNALLIVSGGDEAVSVRDYYGISTDYDIKRIPISGKGRIGQIQWARRTVKEATAYGAGVIVTRDPITACVSVLKGNETVLDLHGDLAHLCGRLYRMIRWKPFVDNRRLHLVFISEGLKNYYVQKYGIKPERATVLPDGCNLSDFSEYAKAHETIEGQLHIGYFGKALVGKGIDLIRRVAELDDEDIFDIYGATREAAEKETGITFSQNVVFHGHINNKEVPKEMCSMDLLLLPNQDKLENEGEDIGKFTSPLKMFEYMASGRVVVASDLPVLREVLDESNSYLVDSRDENKWIEAIKSIKECHEEAIAKEKKALCDVQKYTWNGRAAAMLKLTGN